MAAVEGAPQPKKKASKTGLHRPRRRVGIRIDMTPMVDVAFLLLIFFMVTTVFRKPLAIEVNMPEKDVKVEVPQANVMTIYILSDGSMLYDIGKIGLNEISWDDLESTVRAEADLNPELIVLVKIQRDARYETMVDMLDTLEAAHMQRFSVIQMTPEDETRIEES